MKQYKRLVSVMLAGGLMMGALAGCGPNTAEQIPGSAEAPTDDGVYTVGYLMQDDNTNLDMAMLSPERLEKEVEDRGAEVVFVQADNPNGTQLQQVDNLIDKNVDCLMVAMEDVSDMSLLVSNANAAKIPIVCVGNRSTDCSGTYYYVGSEAYEAGYTQGEYLAQKLDDAAQILYLTNNYYQDQVSADRKLGFTDAMGDYSRDDVEIISEKICESNDQRADAQIITKQWVKQYKTKDGTYAFDAIVAENGQAALGALDILREEGLNGKKLLTCIGGSEELLEAVEAGDIQQTVMVDVSTQAKQSGELLAALALGQETDSEQICVHVSVTEENAADEKNR